MVCRLNGGNLRDTGHSFEAGPMAALADELPVAAGMRSASTSCISIRLFDRRRLNSSNQKRNTSIDRGPKSPVEFVLVTVPQVLHLKIRLFHPTHKFASPGIRIRFGIIRDRGQPDIFPAIGLGNGIGLVFIQACGFVAGALVDVGNYT